jgi:hypothetical protein
MMFRRFLAEVTRFGAPIDGDTATIPRSSTPCKHSMPPIPHLICVYLALAFIIAWCASARGRSATGWLIVALLITPALAVLVLWFLPDLAYEQQRTREFLREAKQRRHRRDPHDTFSRTRERQEQDIQDKVITARLERKRAVEPVPATTRRLRALENRTPATLIMQL